MDCLNCWSENLLLTLTNIYKLSDVSGRRSTFFGVVLPLIFLIFFFNKVVTAQDIHLSQFNNTPLLRNPALAGIFTGNFRVQTAYRSQWRSIAFPYKTNVLGLEYKIALPNGNDFLTVGSSAFYDQAGIQALKTLQVLPVINFHKNLGGDKIKFLSIGFMGGYVSRQFSGANLTFDNQYTNGRFSSSNATGESFTGLSRSVFDMAVGMSYNSQLGENTFYYAGASLWHFNSPSANYLSAVVKLPMKVQANLGIRARAGDYLEWTIEGNHLQQGQYRETIVGGMIKYDLIGSSASEETEMSSASVGLGGFIRLNDAFIPYAYLRYNQMDIGISYDINTSSLKTIAQGVGSIELSISYRGFTQGQNKSLQYIKCPKF
jgi:type IX secretion system PorP/SprF family membrane protein